MMTAIERSSAQVEASRNNGAKSKGPTTPQGKARSSQNAVKHGLYSSEMPFADPEALAGYQTILNRLNDTHIPTTTEEEACVERMALAKWRQGVALRMELALIEAVSQGEACCIAGGQGLPSLGTILRYQSRIARDFAQAREELDDLRRQQMLPETTRKSPSPASFQPMDEALGCLGTNEPKAMPVEDGLNREQRRRLEAINRKRGKTKL